MKNIFKMLMLCFLSIISTSCLESGLEELPAYDSAEITTVSGVYYRYISDEIAPGTDEPVVKDIDLNYKGTVDKEAASVAIEVSTRAGFPAEQLGNLSKSNLVVVISISTAARIFPVGDAPKLGVPADWSKAHTYEVHAADGTIKKWTIEVTTLTK